MKKILLSLLLVGSYAFGIDQKVIINPVQDGDTVVKVNDGGVITPVMTFKGNSGWVGVGTTAPTNQFQISGGSTTGEGSLSINRYSGSAPLIYFYKYNGTSSVPTKVLSGNTIGSIRFAGYQETTGATVTTAQINSLAAEDFTSTAAGSSLTATAVDSGDSAGYLLLYKSGAGALSLYHKQASAATKLVTGTFDYWTS